MIVSALPRGVPLEAGFNLKTALETISDALLAGSRTRDQWKGVA